MPAAPDPPEVCAVYGAGLVQGVALVTIPGPLQELFGIGLTTLFGATSLVAVAMGLIATVVVRGHSRSGLAERGAVVHG